MAVYFAMRIETNNLDYLTVFSMVVYQQFQADTDAILVADGFGNLIVPIA